MLKIVTIFNDKVAPVAFGSLLSLSLFRLLHEMMPHTALLGGLAGKTVAFLGATVVAYLFHKTFALLGKLIGSLIVQFIRNRTLSSDDFPRAFIALEMLWPKRLREEVWRPAFYDEQALYLELREHSWLPMLNVIFTLKVIYLVVVTGRIAFLDWSLSRLTNKRSRLTGKTARRKSRIE